MRTHLRLGRLIGVPIGINWGVLLVSVLLAFSLAEASLPAVAPDHPTSAYWFAAIVGVVAFLVSLVGHELGHSYIAKRNGVNVVEITLWLFGGVAKLEGDADDPGAEFRIALAGPVMSLVCAVVAGGFAWLVEDLDGSRVLVGLLIWLSAINVVLAVSNLIPAFPLDGGRMLRAVLWRRSTHKRRATRQASLIGQLLAGVMIVGAVVLAVRSSLWSGAWLVALGLFLLVAARSEWNAAAAQPELMLAPVGDFARSLPTPLGPRASVADVEGALMRTPGAVFVPLIDDKNQITELVTRDAVARIPPAQRAVVPAISLAEPLRSLPRVSPGESVDTVLTRLGQGETWWALVSDGTALHSVLCSADVDAVLEAATA